MCVQDANVSVYPHNPTLRKLEWSSTWVFLLFWVVVAVWELLLLFSRMGFVRLQCLSLKKKKVTNNNNRIVEV